MKHAYRAKTNRMRAAVKTAALMSLGIPLATLPAVAQDDEGELTPVVITGSNIPTVELEGPSPIVRISREEINRSGAETVGELLRHLPQNNAGSYDEKIGNSFAPGTSGVSLRGLGMGYTLVLVDGRRMGNHSMAHDMTTAFSDLNGVPLAVVERVEVLLDGASAIYGSDAVGGVVNIITRDNFDGVQIRAGYSNTIDDDMGSERYSITGGTVGENGNAWINIDYMQRNSLQMDDRDFSASANQQSAGGYDFRSPSGNPGTIMTLKGSRWDKIPGVSSRPYKVPKGSTGFTTAEEIIDAEGINWFDYNPFLTLTPAIERYGASGHVNYTLTDYANAFVHTTYQNSKTHYQEAPTPAEGYLNTEVIVDGVVERWWGLLPKENYYNPLDEDVTFIHRLLEVGPRLIDIESEVFRFLPGLKFNIGDSWQAETAILYNSVESVFFGRNYVSADALKDALASSDPTTAYNIFGDGYINRPDVLDGLRANILRRAQFELQMWDVKAAGDLYELPGGTLAMAVGAETAKEESSDISDSLSMANKIVGYGGTSNVGSRSRDAGYAEFMIPLIGEDNRIAGIHSLGLQAAWRFEKYSDFGSVDNPKVGLKYQPEEHVLLRATYQTAFRAPSLQELHMGQTVSYGWYHDPARGEEGEYTEKFSGNEDLDPEESDSVSVGVLVNIPMPENMSLNFSVNWSQYEINNQINSHDPYLLLHEERYRDNIVRIKQTGADQAADNPGPDGLLGTKDDIPNGGVPGSINYIDNSFLNKAEVKVESLDLQLDYGIDTSVGYFSANLAATYLYQYDFKARPTDEFREQSGHYNRPEWRGRARIWWTYDKYSAGATINYVDSFAQHNRIVSEYTEVDEHTTLDLQASYDLIGNSRLTVGALNVTDEDPPWANSYEGYAVATAGHSPLGTVLYGRVTIRF